VQLFGDGACRDVGSSPGPSLGELDARSSLAPDSARGRVQSNLIDGRLQRVAGRQPRQPADAGAAAAGGRDLGERRAVALLGEQVRQQARQDVLRHVAVVVLRRRVVADGRRRRHDPRCAAAAAAAAGARLAGENRVPFAVAGALRHDRRLQHPRVLGDLRDRVAAVDLRLEDAVDQVFGLVRDALRLGEANLAFQLVLDHFLHVRVVVRHRTAHLQHATPALRSVRLPIRGLQ